MLVMQLPSSKNAIWSLKGTIAARGQLKVMQANGVIEPSNSP